MYTALTDYAESSVRVEMVELVQQLSAVAHFCFAFGMITEKQFQRILDMVITEHKKTLAQHLNMVNYVLGQLNDKLVEFAKKVETAKYSSSAKGEDSGNSKTEETSGPSSDGLQYDFQASAVPGGTIIETGEL